MVRDRTRIESEKGVICRLVQNIAEASTTVCVMDAYRASRRRQERRERGLKYVKDFAQVKAINT